MAHRGRPGLSYEQKPELPSSPGKRFSKPRAPITNTMSPKGLLRRDNATRSSSSAFGRLSVHPKQSASSTESEYARCGWPLLSL